MKHLAVLSLSGLMTATAGAELVQVDIYGVVAGNSISFGEFANVNAGDAVHVSFSLDSTLFVDSPNFPVRGYQILQDSFTFQAGSVSVGLANPFPAGQTPFFVVRDNDPAVDGFYLSTNVDFPFGVPVNAAAALSDYFSASFEVSYPQDTLSSLDILDALGTYDLTGLSLFSFGLLDASFEPMFIDYQMMTITPAPATIMLLAPLGLVRRRRRA